MQKECKIFDCLELVHSLAWEVTHRFLQLSNFVIPWMYFLERCAKNLNILKAEIRLMQNEIDSQSIVRI